MKNYFAAIDIGSFETKFLVFEKKGKEIHVLFKGKEFSKGVKKGIVVDHFLLSQVLKKISQDFFEQTKKKFPLAIFNLGGTHLSLTESRGLVSVSRPDQKISKEDLERALSAAQLVNLGPNREIFEILPKRYLVDGEEVLEDPVGMKGLRLEIEALIFGGNSFYFENLKRAILASGIEAIDFIPNPLALSRAILREREMELGACVLNLGAQTTEVSIFQKGKLSWFFVLPIGCEIVTKRISVFLKTDFETAEKIKVEFGSLFSKEKREKIVIEKNNISFTKSSLAREIRETYSKIFDTIKKELKKYQSAKDLVAILLTGGGAKIKGIEELARQKFKLYSRVGVPEKILEAEKDPSFSICAGLALSLLEQGETKTRSIFSKILDFFKNFLP